MRGAAARPVEDSVFCRGVGWCRGVGVVSGWCRMTVSGCQTTPLRFRVSRTMRTVLRYRAVGSRVLLTHTLLGRVLTNAHSRFTHRLSHMLIRTAERERHHPDQAELSHDTSIPTRTTLVRRSFEGGINAQRRAPCKGRRWQEEAGSSAVVELVTTNSSGRCGGAAHTQEVGASSHRAGLERRPRVRVCDSPRSRPARSLRRRVARTSA